VERLHTEAKGRGTKASALAEAGILHILNRDPVAASGKISAGSLPKLPTWWFGEMLVDTSNRDGLYRAMEEE
jgi:hypothetical protein